jgi:hypothetical protein
MKLYSLTKHLNNSCGVYSFSYILIPSKRTCWLVPCLIIVPFEHDSTRNSMQSSEYYFESIYYIPCTKIVIWDCFIMGYLLSIKCVHVKGPPSGQSYESMTLETTEGLCTDWHTTVLCNITINRSINFPALFFCRCVHFHRFLILDEFVLHMLNV